jgi:uncharacterized protein YlxW (UPF0749 family)
MEIPEQQPYQSDSDYMDLLQLEIEQRQEQVQALQTEIAALEATLADFQKRVIE